MFSFDEYIHDDNRIISILCKYRAKIADKRHKRNIFDELFPDAPDRDIITEEIESLMPPRRQWVSLNKKYRYKTSTHGSKQPISTQDSNILRLKITIDKALKGGSQDMWVVKLKGFIEKVQTLALDPHYTIKSPITIPIPKNKIELDPALKTECRPISKFESLLDRVILTLANKYLTSALDPYFDTESLAFRGKRHYHGKNSYNTTHHDAIDRITEYRSKHSKRHIYVAECDMQKFYDSVSHSIIRREFKKIITKFQKDNSSINLDAITNIFYKYLECYTFYENVFTLNSNQEFWNKHHIQNGQFGWIDNELIDKRLCASTKYLSRAKIGIPQGGALSGLIANIVLNIADQKVRKTGNGCYLYVRYCDDMILLHTNKYKCRTILKHYIHALEELRLIPHTMEHSLPFRTSQFWKIKSKYVYRWGAGGSDWIGFVGYEVKRSGEIRIRKRSIEKEKNKIKSTVNYIYNKLHNARRGSNSSIMNSIQHKLISMAIGRVSLWNFQTINNELCWINGFNKLNENQYVSMQIRDLDRVRLNAIRALDKHLRDHQALEIVPRDKRGTHITYYGRPFSYHYHYVKNIK